MNCCGVNIGYSRPNVSVNLYHHERQGHRHGQERLRRLRLRHDRHHHATAVSPPPRPRLAMGRWPGSDRRRCGGVGARPATIHTHRRVASSVLVASSASCGPHAATTAEPAPDDARGEKHPECTRQRAGSSRGARRLRGALAVVCRAAAAGRPPHRRRRVFASGCGAADEAAAIGRCEPRAAKFSRNVTEVAINAAHRGDHRQKRETCPCLGSGRRAPVLSGERVSALARPADVTEAEWRLGTSGGRASVSNHVLERAPVALTTWWPRSLALAQKPGAPPDCDQGHTRSHFVYGSVTGRDGTGALAAARRPAAG